MQPSITKTREIHRVFLQTSVITDCSQTLYEFRASNPAALNVLESSGVFTPYKLEINYRSNQEILDFANLGLETIDANKYANIQLHANSLSPVTLSSFKEAVDVIARRVPKQSDFDEALPHIMDLDLKPYIEQKLKNGEKVCCLAFTRQHVAIMESALREMFPQEEVLNLTSEKMYNTTIFSKFIAKYWNEIQFAPTQAICSVIANKVFAHAADLSKGKLQAVQTNTSHHLTKWRDESENMIKGWQTAYLHNTISLDEFLNRVKESMLQFEIRNNAIKQALLSARNDEAKKSQAQSKAQLLVSTIHGAKGLEFDNTIIVCKDTGNMPEDQKRLYYVAFTRAMKSERIIAFTTAAASNVKDQYDAMVQALEAKAQGAMPGWNGTLAQPADDTFDPPF